MSIVYLLIYLANTGLKKLLNLICSFLTVSSENKLYGFMENLHSRYFLLNMHQSVKLLIFLFVFQVDMVVHGETNVMEDVDGTDPYEIPKQMGIFKVISSGCPLTTADIVARIIKHRFVAIHCWTTFNPLTPKI